MILHLNTVTDLVSSALHTAHMAEPAPAQGVRRRRTSVVKTRPPRVKYQVTGAGRAPRNLPIAISLALLAAIVLYANRNGLTKAASPWTVDSGMKPLPETYAVCSREGKRVYTVPADEPSAGAVECVVVGGQRVLDTGSLAHVRRTYGEKGKSVPSTAPAAIQKAGGIKIIYLPAGHTLTPGFTDAHAHPLMYGASRKLQLQGSKSVQEVVDKVEGYVKSHPGREWVSGQGWDQELWPGGQFASAADLDTPVLKGLNIALYRTDVHAVWVSPAVMAKIGDIPELDPEGGHVVRDQLGRPTGVFLDNAIKVYVLPVLPPVTDAQRAEELEVCQRDALALGLTGIHDAGLLPEEIAFFRRMADEGNLKLRFYSMLLCPKADEYCGDQVERVEGAGHGRFTLRSVKLFGDGALGSRGAALLEDYSDKPGWKGFLLLSEETWKPLVKKFYDNGWQVNVHCIGDKANHVVLDAIEALGDKNVKERRLRIEHAQIFTPDDIKRAAKLGVIGSYQPTHATSDVSVCLVILTPDVVCRRAPWPPHRRSVCLALLPRCRGPHRPRLRLSRRVARPNQGILRGCHKTRRGRHVPARQGGMVPC